MRRATVAVALCVVCLAASAEAAVKRDTRQRDTVVAKALRQLKKVFVPGSQDDQTWPKP